jgi:CheY-like chemotaxis protein
MNQNRTVLLVDDSENDLLLTRFAFKEAGFDSPLQEVHNGEEAIAYLKGEGPYSDRNTFPLPAVMLMDLNMPRKNGFDVLKWVRTQPAFKRMPVIVLSASKRPEDVAEAYDLGANSYLVKSGSLGDLIDMIRSLRDWLRYNHFPPLNETVRR